MPRVVPDKDKQKARMEMRITEQDQDDFAQAAELVGANSASEWARSALRVLAREIIAKHPKKKR